jgi:hypothetical protein
MFELGLRMVSQCTLDGYVQDYIRYGLVLIGIVIAKLHALFCGLIDVKSFSGMVCHCCINLRTSKQTSNGKGFFPTIRKSCSISVTVLN